MRLMRHCLTMYDLYHVCVVTQDAQEPYQSGIDKLFDELLPYHLQHNHRYTIPF